MQVKSFLLLVTVNNERGGNSALSHQLGTDCLGNSFAEKDLGDLHRHQVEHEPVMHPGGDGD